MEHDGFAIVEREGPVIACALHAGHAIRPEMLDACALAEGDRLREEDPHTDVLADIGVTTVVAERSRFEVDLNRPREEAVYRGPAEAWGLTVWREPLSADRIARSLDIHDRFYEAMRDLLARTVKRHGAAVVFDVHSYNHRREGAEVSPDDPAANPEVNIGTGTLDRSRWGPLVDRVTDTLRAAGLDVRENVRFRGGYFAAWAHETFAGDVAVLALEFKKVFMDEWSGAVDRARLERSRTALARCVPEVRSLIEEARR